MLSAPINRAKQRLILPYKTPIWNKVTSFTEINTSDGIYLPDLAVYLNTPALRILDIPGSNLDSKAGYPDPRIFVNFLSLSRKLYESFLTHHSQ